MSLTYDQVAAVYGGLVVRHPAHAHTMINIVGRPHDPAALQNRLNGLKAIGSLADTFTGVSEIQRGAPSHWRCAYCGGLRHGDDCDGCGAPRIDPLTARKR